MDSHLQQPKSISPRWIYVIIALSFFLVSASSAFADTAAVKARKSPKKVVRRVPAPVPILPGKEVRETNLTVPPPAPSPRLALVDTKPAATSLNAQAKPLGDENPARIINLRLHPIYLMSVLTQKDTVFSIRADLDFVLGDRFTLGPSVIYTRTSTLDGDFLASQGVAQYTDLGVLELGVLANIYLTGTTATGGFLLRPHVYWIDPSGQKSDDAGNLRSGASSTQAGVRGGAEFLYQKILSCGLNFEIGAGVSYYFVPYSVNYSDGGVGASQPDNRLMPTVSAGIGWAF